MGFLSTTDAGAADAEYSSFWASAGTSYTFPTSAPEAQATTTSIANPIVSAALLVLCTPFSNIYTRFTERGQLRRQQWHWKREWVQE